MTLCFVGFQIRDYTYKDLIADVDGFSSFSPHDGDDDQEISHHFHP